MKIRLNERILARKLRSEGLSFSEILQRIPNLPKGTLNGWLKDIELTEKQKERLLSKIKRGADKGRQKGAFINHKRRIDITNYIIECAKDEIKLNDISSLFTLGVMLYWAEGNKTGERVGFTNSDPIMIRLMMKWFRNHCYVPEAKFRVSLQIMSLHNKNDCERFWSTVTHIPLQQFNKTIVKSTMLNGKRNPSYYGTCTIRISDKNLFRKILGWKLGIIEGLKLGLHSSIG